MLLHIRVKFAAFCGNMQEFAVLR